MAVAERHLIPESRAARRMPRWPRSKAAVAVRAILHLLVLLPAVRWFCRPMRVEGRRRLARVRGPVLLVANHASHADTAAITSALPARLRARTAPAAAEDYFFKGRLRGAIVSLVVGAYPFPRRGGDGLARAEELMEEGWSVLLFPEGTRSPDGRMRPFKTGASVLAARGATVVPVGIAGTRDVLPKGGRMPRRAPVAVVFGEPVHVEPGASVAETAARIERRVSRLRAAARLLRPAPKRTAFQRVRALACSPAGLWFAFGWGVAEALFFPIVPDVAVVALAVAAPRRCIPLGLCALAGSLAGGSVAYVLGGIPAGGWLLAHAPLVTDRMRSHALDAMGSGGAAPLFGQPWGGIPFKVYGYQAAWAGVGFGSFAFVGTVGRAVRILLAAAVFAVPSWAGSRAAPRLVERLYGPFLLAFCGVFSIGLARVVAAWS